MDFPERLPIPPVVVDVARRLDREGFETWCVGGAVRDNLLGYPNDDFDMATAALPQEIQRCFPRTVPIGIAHGTVAVLDRHNRPHEVTTFRRDVRTDGRHAVVEFGVSLDEDLERRDFTINAIAYHPLRHEWRDPLGGAEDLDRKIIRAVGDPATRFREDFLRILRALRFAARFGFSIDPATLEAASRSIDGLRGLSAERVRDEWFKGLSTAQSVRGFVESWHRMGASAIWLPELGSETAAASVANVDGLAARDPVLITSYLSQDPGATLRRLRCANAEIERAERIARFRTRRPDPSVPAEVRHWLAEVGSTADDVLAIDGATGGSAALADAVRRVRESGAPLSQRDLVVDGDDLLGLGVPEGPAIGSILLALLGEVLDDPALNSRDVLLARARVLAADHAPSQPGR